MGANSWQTVFLALLPELFTGILAVVLVSAITLVGYSAMSGVIGGGGLGDLALRFGYQRYQTDVMIVTVLILIILVQLIQMFGDYLIAVLQKNTHETKTRPLRRKIFLNMGCFVWGSLCL